MREPRTKSGRRLASELQVEYRIELILAIEDEIIDEISRTICKRNIHIDHGSNPVIDLRYGSCQRHRGLVEKWLNDQ